MLDLLIATYDGEILAIRDTARLHPLAGALSARMTCVQLPTSFPRGKGDMLTATAGHGPCRPPCNVSALQVTGVGCKCIGGAGDLGSQTLCAQGELMTEKLVVPRLRVRRDWHNGLQPDPINRAADAVGARADAQDGTLGNETLSSQRDFGGGAAARSRRRLLMAGDAGRGGAVHSRRRLLQARTL